MVGKKKAGFEDVSLDDINDNIEDVLEKDEFSMKKRKGLSYYMCMKKEVIVAYLVCFCVALLVAAPLTLQSSGFFPKKEEKTILGICGVRSNFRIDCAPDLETISVEECESRECCWDSDTPNATCYHRMPSPKSVRISSWNPQDDPYSGQIKTFKLDGSVSKAQFQVTGTGKGHILFQLGTHIDQGLGSNPDAEPNLKTTISCADAMENPTCIDDVLTFDISFQNSTSGLSLIRSHFGPMIYNSEMSEISLYLPNNMIYAMGLDNLTMGSVQEKIYFNLDGQSQVHLPVVFGMYDVQRWYLLYLETDQPVVQTLRPGSGDQPVLTWTFMGDDIKIHLLEDSSPLNLQKKLSQYVSGTHLNQQSKDTLKLKFGYHLCRRTSNLQNFYNDQDRMIESEIPYDYDCVDENLMRTAFIVDQGFLPKTVIAKTVLPLPVQILNNTSPEIPCVTRDNTTTRCVIGRFNGKDVYFPNVFDAGYTSFVNDKLFGLETELVEKSAVYLHDVAPTDQNEEDFGCQEFDFVPKGLLRKDQLCLSSHVKTTDGDNMLLNKMADYSRKAVTVLSNSDLQDIRTDVAMLGMPSHVTFTGSKFSATWADIKKSLLEVLMLSSVGLPYYSMSACGNSPTNASVDGLLCLRWFQLASYMPGIHSWYQDKESERLPFNLPKSYERYVKWALEERYRMFPYFKTIEYEWRNKSIPMVRPMFLMNPEAKYLDLWSQFYLGDRILVAPVLHENQDIVSVKFPPGTWYTLGSRIPVSLDYQGATITIHSKLYEIPAFMKGGSVLVYHETIGKNLIETEEKAYLLIIPLECARSPRGPGQLYGCNAEGDTYLGQQAMLNIKVETSNTTGRISFLTMGVPSPEYLNTIGSMEIIGLKSAGAQLDITLPDGNSLTADNDGEGSDHEDGQVYAIYNDDKQSLLVRNMNLTSDGYKDSNLTWVFQEA